MPNKFGDISSNIDILDGQVLRSKTDGTGFESYDIESALDNKADQSTTYTKTETDNLLNDKIDASDIVNFETTTQLNARDTANRNRSNHTGTQIASTISDFDTEVSNNTNVSANTAARHTHTNSTILNQISNNPVETIVAGTNVSVSRTGNSVTINSTGSGGGATTLDDLTDVTLTTPATGQALTYNGTQWINSTPAGAGDMLKTENLSGLTNYSTARTNLGLNTTVNQTDSTDKRFMTDAQESKLDAITGTNTGDETKAKIESKLTGTITSHNHSGVYQPLATVLTNTTASYTTTINARLANTSGTNTGDQDISGKQNILSEGAFVNGDKTKLDGIESGAEVNNISDINATDLTDGGDTVLHLHDSRYYTESETDTLLSGKSDTSHNHSGVYEPVFSKNTAFNKNFGTTVGSVLEGNSNLGLVGTKEVDEVAIDNDKILVYKTASGKLEYESKPTGGGAKQHRVTIPGELIADTSNYQGLYFYNDTGVTITISNVAIAVGKAAAGSGAACAINLYKSSGTASDGLNTSAVNLFTTAVDLGTGYTSLTNVPNTTTVEAGRWVTLRVTSSAGATNKASDLQCIITYS